MSCLEYIPSYVTTITVLRSHGVAAGSIGLFGLGAITLRLENNSNKMRLVIMTFCVILIITTVRLN